MIFSFTTTHDTIPSPLTLHDALPISLERREEREVGEPEGLLGRLEPGFFLGAQPRRSVAPEVRERGAQQTFLPRPRRVVVDADRKSTRLNSSHLVISYAVFCLKKKIK